MALADLLGNAEAMSGLRKIFSFEERYHAETMENAALSDVVNTPRIIQAAAAKRSARNVEHTIRSRMETLK